MPTDPAAGPPSQKQGLPQIVFTPQQMAEWSAKAKHLLEDEDARQKHLAHQVMLHMLILEHIIQNPPAGRSATATVVKSLQNYAALAYELHEKLNAKAKPGKGVLGGAGDQGWVRGKRGAAREPGEAT